ncbi:hypothetical protein ACIA5G_08265 [Amycolatopsis sp. NPDC051758]|uniref:hypothetical protein n=1 Tax=Amycolatopsis sp. NPDC051758 TaxID=3363935 RepID=UPI0037A25E8A
MIEQKPASAARRTAVIEDIVDSGIDLDAELVAAAQKLVDEVQRLEGNFQLPAGLDLERVQAQFLRVRSVESEGTGVRVVDGAFEGGIDVGTIKSGKAQSDGTTV